MPETNLSELIADIREQVLFLKEMGVDSLSADPSLLRNPLPSVANDKLIVDSLPQETADRTARPPISGAEPQARRVAGSRLKAMPSLKDRTAISGDGPLRSVPQETERPKPLEEISNIIADKPSAVLPIMNETKDTIEVIRAEIGDCTRCPLHSGRKQIVHTTGNFQADLMFIGEAPGGDEDEQGYPFVGRAGKLLTDIIKAMGFERENVCIGNINRCRPPANRKPEPNETAACRPYILREIAVVKPRVVVVLGATAAHNLLQVKTPITKLRGHFHDHFGVKVMPTFHPAYLLRDPHKKREVWDDMKRVRDFLNETS